MKYKFDYARKEIHGMDIVSSKFISKNWRLSSSPPTKETINQNLFNGLFDEADLRTLFAQKIFSRN